MGLNDTPRANRIHIGFFGARNAGKSSLVNAVTNQSIALVSDERGTTTDPVYKAMELLPIGPVMIIDTPGFDDSGKLGELRVSKTRQVLNKTDIAVLVIDAAVGLTPCDSELISLFREKNIPYCVAYNKCDLVESFSVKKGDLVAKKDNFSDNKCNLIDEKESFSDKKIYVSAMMGDGIGELLEKISSLARFEDNNRRIVGDLIGPSDFVLLVTPIDSAAPKGRLILPQQQTIRDILDAGAVAIVIKENEIAQTLKALGKKPSLVICDSQAFKVTAENTPRDIPLTSFSILMARYKGFLETALQGAAKIDKLQDGDTVLISEGCTHRRQCGDIGTVKLPNLLKKHTGKDLNLRFTSGTEFPEDLDGVALVIHCGGCMITEREVAYRARCANEKGVDFTNYGIALAHLNGILERSVEILTIRNAQCAIRNC